MKKNHEDQCIFDFLMKERRYIRRHKIPIIVFVNSEDSRSFQEFAHNGNNESVEYMSIHTNGLVYLGFESGNSDVKPIMIDPLEYEFKNMQRILNKQSIRVLGATYEVDEDDPNYKWAKKISSILYHKILWATYINPQKYIISPNGFGIDYDMFVKRGLVINYSSEFEEDRSLEKEPEFLPKIPMANVRYIIQ